MQREAHKGGAVPGEPWGPWPTLGITAALVATFIVVQSFVMGIRAAWVTANQGEFDADRLADMLSVDGLGFALGSLTALPITLALTLLFVFLRKDLGWTEYLAVRPVKVRTLAWSLTAVLIFGAAYDLMTSGLGRPLVPDVMVELYAGTRPMVLLWIAFVVSAPLIEETLFRGFLWAGLESSWLGQTGTVLVTSLFWAVLHLQYDALDILCIFALGLLLGWVRAISGSMIPCLAMHMLVNLLATVQTALLAADRV